MTNFYCYVYHWYSPRFGLLTGLLLALNTLPLLAQTIRYVKTTAIGSGDGSSWANASASLQTIINASASGDQVWVAAGTYKPTPNTDRTISFAMKNGVALYGGFAGTETALGLRPAINATTPSSTTLSGDIGTVGNNIDNSYRVISNSAGLTNSAILDGFVVTGGNANDTIGQYSTGGGMFNNGTGSGNVCSPMIRQCVFVANQAYFGGAIENETTSGNSSPVLVNCVFQSNTAITSGGAMFNYQYSGSSSPQLTNCVFLSNTAGSGGAITNSGYLGSSRPMLTNCSFQSNTAINLGGAMYNNGGSGGTNPQLTNCVLWGNGGTNTFYNTNSSAMVSASYSLFDASVTGYTSTTGNLATITSPFASSTTTQLSPTSPAINTGDPNTTPTTGTPAPVGTTDLADNPRFAQGRIDMGAFEWGNGCQGLITSLKAGSWDDPAVWTCNTLPLSTDIVQINHAVSLPTSYTAQAKTLRCSTTEKITYQMGATAKLDF